MSRSFQLKYFQKSLKALSSSDLGELYKEKIVNFEVNNIDFYESKRPKLFQIFMVYLTKLEVFFDCDKDSPIVCSYIQKMMEETSDFTILLRTKFSKVNIYIACFIFFYLKVEKLNENLCFYFYIFCLQKVSENFTFQIDQKKVEGLVVKTIDTIKVNLDLEEFSFTSFQEKNIYPFLKMIIKKFPKYGLIKHFLEISETCGMDYISSKIFDSLKLVEKKMFKNNSLFDDKFQSQRKLDDKSVFQRKSFKNKNLILENENKFNKKDGFVTNMKKVNKWERRKSSNLMRHSSQKNKRFESLFQKFMMTPKGNPKSNRKSPMIKKEEFFRLSQPNGINDCKNVPNFFRANDYFKNNSICKLEIKKKTPKKIKKKFVKKRKLPSVVRGPSKIHRTLQSSFRYKVKKKKEVTYTNNIINRNSSKIVLDGFLNEMQINEAKINNDTKISKIILNTKASEIVRRKNKELFDFEAKMKCEPVEIALQKKRFDIKKKYNNMVTVCSKKKSDPIKEKKVYMESLKEVKSKFELSSIQNELCNNFYDLSYADTLKGIYGKKTPDKIVLTKRQND